MPLPFTPESMNALRARYPRALAHTYDHGAILSDGAIRPGECAANIFDFDNNLRLIISREKLVSGEVALHISASLHGAWIGDRVSIVDQFRQLSGDWRRIEFLGLSEKGIPHWFIKETDK